MERNSETKTLSFSKGMTNIPSDLLCEDSELLESDGFIYKDGEMKPIQKPKLKYHIPYKLQYVHKGADYKNLIAYDEANNKLHCYLFGEDGIGEAGNSQSFGVDGLLDVKSIGNTLVCATSGGLRYILYKGGRYKDLGTELPKPSVAFKFEEVNNPFKANDGRTPLKIESFLALYKTYNTSFYYDINGDFIGAHTTPPSSYAYKYPHDFGVHSLENSKIEDFRNAVQGHVSEAINWAEEKGYFCFPFFARFALELFDGSYARISAPVICYPTISKNCEIRFATSDKKYTDQEGIEQWTGNIVPCNVFLGTFNDYFYFIHCTKMFCKFYLNEIEDWKDIVKKITVFVSDKVVPFKIDGEYWQLADSYKNTKQVIYNDIRNGSYFEKQTDFHVGANLLATSVYQDQLNPYQAIEPTYKTEAEIKKELLGKTQFYKLFSVDTDSDIINTNIFVDTLSADNGVPLVNGQVLKNITVQQQLEKDDYYGWAKITSTKLFTYNKRINLIGIKRFPSEGFNMFRSGNGEVGDSAYGYVKFYVHIVSMDMDTWVSSAIFLINQGFNLYNDWYYYPDPNATEMVILLNLLQEGKQKYYYVKLSQHPTLNGSYSFRYLPPASLIEGKKDMTFGGYETLNSQIFTSVVNNPFVFEASGDNTVGTGKILGIVANTEAVSQGQFGQYPLLVFTSEGIYGMSVNSEGLYSATYPISREVCLENSPLVPTDRLIFFASKKGLMAASGGSVGYMSEQLRGRQQDKFTYYRLTEGPFELERTDKMGLAEFLQNCLIAYDYRDSMLRIFRKDKDYQYIYNMVDKTFAVDSSGIVAQAVVNDYPDNLIQGTDGNVYSLTDKPNINEDDNLYSGTVITRPLKLGGFMTLKSLRKIVNLRNTAQGKLGLEAFANNNAGGTWCKLVSLLGKPWGFFTFKYTLTDFKARDSFVGSIVTIQNRRPNPFQGDSKS